MGLIKCKDCGAEISEDCTTCPNCGANILKQTNPNLQKQVGCGMVILWSIPVIMSIWAIIDMGSGLPLFIAIVSIIGGAIGILSGISKMLK